MRRWVVSWACTPWIQDPEAADSAMREVGHSLLSAPVKRNCDPFAIRRGCEPRSAVCRVRPIVAREPENQQFP